ncbi:MAG: TldD/PmbA family protein [Candidatus Bathyarchaeia archaeon]
MPSKSEILSFAELAVKNALQSGADQAEAYGEISRRITISISGRKIQSVQVIHDSGVGVRTYINGGLGYAYTMRLDKQTIKETAVKAAKLAKVSEKDPYFKSIPEAEKPKSVEGIYDQELASLQVAGLAKIAEDMIKTAQERSRKIILTGTLYTITRSYAIANSLGVEFEESGTNIFTYMKGIIRESASNVGSGTEFDCARNLKDFNAKWVAYEVATKALRALGAKVSKTRTCTILLSPNATYRFSQTLSSGLDGLNVALDRSYLSGMIGKKIASEKLTLTDDGLVEKGFLSSSVDSEGVPKRRFNVIENGVLKTYLHNSYTANRLNMENNACAARDSYKSAPIFTTLSNVQIKPGDQELDEITSEIKDGVYLDSFPMFSDPVTGNISSMIDFGIDIRNGELAEPIKGTMIGFNMLELLKNINAISKEARRTAGMIMPYIRIKDIQITGK